MGDFNWKVEDVDLTGGGDYENLPDGTYKFVVDSSCMKEPRAGGTPYLALVLTVLEGDYENRKFFCNLSFQHQNEVPRRIAMERITELCLAVGYKNMEGVVAEDFTDKSVVGRLKTGKNGRQNLVAFGPIVKENIENVATADADDDSIPF